MPVDEPGTTIAILNVGDTEIRHGHDDREYTIVRPSEGPNVAVSKDPETGRWWVSILTEDMPESQHDDNGFPYLEVTLNDGPIYDKALDHPDTNAEKVKSWDRIYDLVRRYKKSDLSREEFFRTITRMISENPHVSVQPNPAWDDPGLLREQLVEIHAALWESIPAIRHEQRVVDRLRELTGLDAGVIRANADTEVLATEQTCQKGVSLR